LKEKETYGILVIDATATTMATLEGNRLEIVDEVTSGVPGKHRAGGQSARRFERLREAQLLSYYKRVGEHANKAFLSLPNLKGLIIGGPGPTKYEFEKGDFLHYTLKNKIIDTIDTAYVGEQGVQEIVDKAPEILQKVRYVEEKRIMQEFLYEIGHDTGLATYGEDEVKKGLKMGAVKTLLLSEDLDLVRATVKCTSCGYQEQKTMRSQAFMAYKQSLTRQSCPKCKTPTLALAETKEIIEDLAELAEQAGAEVEVVSGQTEEGQMLKKSFGGIAAVLRFKLSN
jgi:peptide chain release factor subunit 1